MHDDRDSQQQHGVEEIGIFVMTKGGRAPDGGYRQCRVQASLVSGKIVLAALDDPTFSVIIRTVTAGQLDAILSTFYVAPALPEWATG